jgi:uncharacterized membrane-anchored protein
MKVRNLVLWLVAMLTLGVVNVLTFQQEHLITKGQVAFLELAPVDPRSLLQGDYMRLRYAISREIEHDVKYRNGFVVVRLDTNRVAHYVRVHDPQTPLSENELLLRYRHRTFDTRIGPESFFFQEGHAHYYDGARYAELRVSESGDVLLVGLCDERLEVLGP